jgi:hypothetical protein
MYVPRSILLEGKRWIPQNKAPPEPASPDGATTPRSDSHARPPQCPSVPFAAWATKRAHDEYNVSTKAGSDNRGSH